MERKINRKQHIIRGRKELTIKRKHLENKSRKGWYYYIKEKYGKAKYYKIREGVDLDNYLMAYAGDVRIKKKGVIQYNRESPAERYLKKVGKSQKLEQLIRKGITEAQFANLKYLGKKNIHQTYVALLKPLVKDKDLLNVIAREENVQKFKFRIQTEISINSQDGEIQVNLKTFNKDLATIKTEFRDILNSQSLDEEKLQQLMKKGYSLNGMPKGVDITGSKYHIITNKLGSIQVKIKFVKGK